MLIEILRHTPAWAFFVFFALLAYGIRLARPSVVHRVRLAIVPLAMSAFALASLVATFGTAPLPLAMMIAVAGAIAIAAQALGPQRDVRYAADTHRFTVPGSLAPLALMMAIFCMRYAVAVVVALHPSSHADPRFALLVAVLYGATSGAFLARALRIGRHALAVVPGPAGRFGPGSLA